MAKKAKEAKHVKHAKEPRVLSWRAMRDRVYAKIVFYATRFILIAVVGVVIGFAAVVYTIVNLAFLSGHLFDITVVIGVLVGAGAIVASLILLIWGWFWRRQVDREKLF